MNGERKLCTYHSGQPGTGPLPEPLSAVGSISAWTLMQEEGGVWDLLQDNTPAVCWTEAPIPD